MNIAIIRGKYLNRFEMQNYEPIAAQAGLVGFSSLRPIHNQYNFPVKKLFSPMDLPDFPKKMPILNRIFSDALYLPGLEKELKGFDIAHTRETYFRITQQAINAKKRGLVKKVVCTCSETIPFNHEGIRGRKKYKQNAYRYVDHFHCLTEKARQCLIKEGVSKSKISVIGYGIDLNAFKPKPTRPHKSINILFVGRLVPEKGIIYLLKAFSRLEKQYPVHLTVVGKGPLKGYIGKYLTAHNLSKKVTVRTCSYAQMPALYRQSDIFVLPSYKTVYWEEYYGMSLLEAMACGLAVVATECGAIPEVTGGNALLVRQKNSQVLAWSLARLLDSQFLLKQQQTKALAWAKLHFDARIQSAKILKLYTKING